VASRGAGNVVRSFVRLTSILRPVKRIPMLKNHTTLRAVNRRQVSNRRIIALADIILIARNGGPEVR